MRMAFALNVLFTVLEFIGGIWTNSIAIISDALHDLGDSMTLGAAWVAEKGARKPPDNKRTFGYARLSLFAAFFSGAVLLGGSLFILKEAIERLFSPEPVYVEGMLVLAVVGVVINGAGFIRLKRGGSMNERVLSWHLLEDVLGWVVIFFGALAMSIWDIFILDPIMTIGYTLFILYGVGRNMKETVNIFLQGVPKHIDLESMKKEIVSVDGVKRVHDVHVWSLEGETDVFTAHVVVDDCLLGESNGMRQKIKEVLAAHHIEHSTIELESEDFCSGIECGQCEGKE